MEVSYNFDDPILKVPRYRRLAREHLSIAQLESDRIKWKAIKFDTHLNIPIEYEIDYLVKSIIGINEDESPIYGNKHTIKIIFPAKFPLETFIAKAESDIWHPNIKWNGPLKGRICVNNQGFGVGFDIFWLLLRIGEIIQYKNYLAENIAPYPEDAEVAKWVLRYAEPNNVVSLQNNIVTDESNLLEYTTPAKPEKKKIVIKKVSKIKVKIKNVNKKN